MQVFQDQSHIDQVRDALWGNYGNGASVMVGSGFSRFAWNVRPSTSAPSMMPDVAIEIHKRLYPELRDQDSLAEASATILAERMSSLAQEYETAFERSNLHQLVQQLIRDEDLIPEELHSRLLQLPWRDVFTTNWDTLLERTRPQVADRAYSIVRDMDEIPLARQPRIVKLHGSFPAQFPLIVTEEDYRTYPTKFAPFVNTVQQAMMETVFCLVGFSGNDPNFLNWAGWVRDNLGDSAPRIYLAGWLNLSHHRRRMLERRGVVPIDLALHPSAQEWPNHQRHRYAVEWVLHTLERGRPYDLTYWPLPSSQPYSEVPKYLQPVMEITSKQPKQEPTGDSRLEADRLQAATRETLHIWRYNRQVYPGWLLLPAGEERETFRASTNSWEHHILNALPMLTAVEGLSAIYELVWRREILLEPISDDLEAAAEDALKRVKCEVTTTGQLAEASIDWDTIREAWLSVALALITVTRFRLDDDLFDERTKALEPFIKDHPEVYHRLFHERCLKAIYSMGFETLERLLEDWMVRNSDPIWMIRKAALLWESERNDEAAELIKQALDSVRSIADVEGSVAGASREGWALWSAFTIDNRREFRKRWDELAALKCDAMLERDIITRQINGDRESGEAPVFDLGLRRGEGVRFSSFRPDIAAYRAVLLSEVAGLPPATKHTEPLGTAVASHALSSAAEVLATSEPELAIRLVLRVCNSETDKTLNRVLTRTRVAALSDSSVRALSNVCVDVINYAFPRLVRVDRRQRSFFWTTRMRVAIEVLSRLALRAAPGRAEDLLDIGLQCFKSHDVAQEHWLYEPVRNLLQRSWEAMPTERRHARAIDLLSAPIVGMDNFSASIPDHFPDPGEFLRTEDLAGERTLEDKGRWQDAISFLLRGLVSDDESRNRASSRILLLSNKGLLTEAESSSLAHALWNEKYTGPDDLPVGTSLSDWAFLLHPEPKPGMAEQRFRLKWLSGDTSKFQGSAQSEGNTVSVSFGARPIDTNKIEDALWNMGTAMLGLRNHDRPLQFTEGERKYIVDMVEQWVHADNAPPTLPFFQAAAREPTRRALRGLASILVEGVIPRETGGPLYEKVKRLGESGTPGFELIHGLIRTIPDQSEELLTWLRMGLASDDDSLAASAMSGLHSWLTASAKLGESSPTSPPGDLLREVGFIIASRRSVPLTHALQLAKWVFDHGTSGYREAMGVLAIHGLSYLAEELRYDRDRGPDDNTDLPLLRWHCAQLAQSMAQSGFTSEPAVDSWLKLGEGDPLPEVRYTVAPTAFTIG